MSNRPSPFLLLVPPSYASDPPHRGPLQRPSVVGGAAALPQALVTDESAAEPPTFATLQDSNNLHFVDLTLCTSSPPDILPISGTSGLALTVSPRFCMCSHAPRFHTGGRILFYLDGSGLSASDLPEWAAYPCRSFILGSQRLSEHPQDAPAGFCL
ncbi:hypothetical protein N8T08_008897 [Aspergillus melleus]|uniref:Uncharacterized protein n=1 Tax=Aspergillus melleus TaxID=138277 RepID=A0ACC3AUY1_9EURO|nr:hypothetical protein N8T08_008897 [Aspergillus melleus]